MRHDDSLRVVSALFLLVATAALLWWAGAAAGVIAAVLAGGGGLFWLGRRAPPPAPPTGAAAASDDGDRVQLLIEAITEPILIIADDRVANANAAALALLGAHIVGEHARLAIRHPEAAERLTAPLATLPGAPVSLVGIGTREARWEMQVGALDDGRRLVHLSDRTGSHAAERMRVDFVANASHELRTPLAAILGFVETLADDKAGGDPPTRRRFLKVMDDEARRMGRLVDDLMSLSRIEADKFRAPDSPIDLVRLVEEVRATLAASHGNRGRDLTVVMAQAPPPVVGDTAQLSQLLHNLVGNAMKYGKPGTPVTITLAPGPETMVQLTVADEGEGIPAEHLPRLTERFYRVDSGRSRALGGTGLGLAIVKHIVERHRGRLDIASIAGVGTTVTVLLPALSSNCHGNITQGA
ncbi:sensor histidine kinase [Sphingomonas flavalba]|uniref:sensor histidine kinase n=1 Tax=Sphingomonas flavalba TaxID=2559804 RepID=UPI0039DFDF41